MVGAFVSLLIVRSISIPLRQLTEGTRAIAAGKFYYRLDTSGKDEFAQVARDFNTMTERLGELDIMKKDFVSHVSHELKAPLASMRETTQLLLEQIPGPLTDKQRRLLELNMQSARTLSSIIGNLLDISKMEAGIMEYDLKPQPLAPWCGRGDRPVRGSGGGKADPASRRSSRKSAVLVDCDGDRIVQVIANLFGNAVKFTPKSGTVRVRRGTCRGVPDPHARPGGATRSRTRPPDGASLNSRCRIRARACPIPARKAFSRSFTGPPHGANWPDRESASAWRSRRPSSRRTAAPSGCRTIPRAGRNSACCSGPTAP